MKDSSLYELLYYLAIVCVYKYQHYSFLIINC